MFSTLSTLSTLSSLSISLLLRLSLQTQIYAAPTPLDGHIRSNKLLERSLNDNLNKRGQVKAPITGVEINGASPSFIGGGGSTATVVPNAVVASTTDTTSAAASTTTANGGGGVAASSSSSTDMGMGMEAWRRALRRRQLRKLRPRQT